jgi:hypothetical protein
MTGLHRINSADHLREFTGLWIRLQDIHLTTEEELIKWKFTASGLYSSIQGSVSWVFFGHWLLQALEI